MCSLQLNILYAWVQCPRPWSDHPLWKVLGQNNMPSFLSSLILSCCWSDFLSSVVQVSISTFPLSLCVFVNEVCAFVCVCMLLMCTQCTCMYSVAYSHLCVSVEARGVALQELSSIYLVFWDREFPLAWNSLVRLGWLTRKLKPSTYLCFLRARPPMDPCHIFL